MCFWEEGIKAYCVDWKKSESIKKNLAKIQPFNPKLPICCFVFFHYYKFVLENEQFNSPKKMQIGYVAHI